MKKQLWQLPVYLTVAGIIFRLGDWILCRMAIGMEVYGPLRLLLAVALFLLVGVKVHKTYTFQKMLIPVGLVVAYGMMRYWVFESLISKWSPPLIAIYKAITVPVDIFYPMALFSFHAFQTGNFVTDVMFVTQMMAVFMPCLLLVFAKKDKNNI